MPAEFDANNRRLGWLAVGLALALGIVVGRTTSLPFDALLGPIVAAVLVLSGLRVLFPLAAYGPTADMQGEARVRAAAVGAGQVALGVAVLIPVFLLSLAVIVLSGIFVFTASRGIPKRLFAPQSRRAG